jgi:hypothetical protein
LSISSSLSLLPFTIPKNIVHPSPLLVYGKRDFEVATLLSLPPCEAAFSPSLLPFTIPPSPLLVYDKRDSEVATLLSLPPCEAAFSPSLFPFTIPKEIGHPSPLLVYDKRDSEVATLLSLPLCEAAFSLSLLPFTIPKEIVQWLVSIFCTAVIMENCSRPLSGTIHDTTYLWLFGALKELVNILHSQNELQHLDSVASLIESTAINVALRLGSRAVTIRFA